MTRRKIVRYTVELPDCSWSREFKTPYGTSWGNFEFAKNWHIACKWARKMGSGAIIQRVTEKRNGKRQVKEWEYKPLK